MWNFTIIPFFSRNSTAPVGSGLLIFEASRSNLDTPHVRYDSSGRVIDSSQRPLRDNTYKRQTPMHPVGFECTILASKRPQTHALDSAATGMGNYNNTR